MNEELQQLKEQMENISYIAYEACMERHAQREYRQMILHLIIEVVLILLLVGTNIAWFIYTQQFEIIQEETTTITLEGVEQITGDNGNNNIVGGDIIGETNR